ncbi:uncharacterized protein V1518DRAFT_409602 [Limtongia smithiae]|uniref:uncharacterized protein n=1 Tax=Limtongia smithiae TaxID=1125753 RepID=UPI0034CE40C9
MRLVVYGASSTVLAVGVVLSAFQRRPNFYSATIYLAQSNACLMALANMGVFIAVLFGRLVQTILFGALRPVEIERLYEKTWYAVTETCLAMTIFRDEFDARFLVMFTTLLFLKIFHWLAADRVEYMEQTAPVRPRLFHSRVAATLLLINAIDMCLIRYALEDILMRGPNMMVMFAFEFAILETSAMAIAGRYVLALIELRVVARAGGEEDTWERKGEFMFYLDLVADFIKLFIYLTFFLLVLTVYGLPLHIVRDVYLTMRSFTQRIRDFVRYRQATSQMNSRYPDATAEEVQRENICIICREEMIVATSDAVASVPGGSGTTPTPPAQRERMRPKKLPCGHVLHFGCLRSWLERQQSCPTCRRPVLGPAANTPLAPAVAVPPTPPPAPHQPPQQPQPPAHVQAPPQHANQRPAANPTVTVAPQPSTHNHQPNFAHPAQLPQSSQSQSEQSARFPTTPATLAAPLSLPTDFALPQGWALLPMRQLANGVQQLQIRDNVWLTLASVQYVAPLGNGLYGPPPAGYADRATAGSEVVMQSNQTTASPDEPSSRTEASAAATNTEITPTPTTDIPTSPIATTTAISSTSALSETTTSTTHRNPHRLPTLEDATDNDP